MTLGDMKHWQRFYNLMPPIFTGPLGVDIQTGRKEYVETDQRVQASN